MQTLQVFLSSVINERTKPFRAFIKRNLEASGWARVWVFETEPPHPSLKQSYLPQVERSDIFVLVVWDDISDVVESEFETAQASKIPVLLLRAKDEAPSERLRSFISRVSSDLKWAEYAAAELPSAVQEGIMSLLIDTYRTHHLRQTMRQQPEPAGPQQAPSVEIGVPKSEQDAVLLAGCVLPGRIARAIPFFDEADGRSRIAVLTKKGSPSYLEKVFLLAEFGGGYRVEWESRELASIGAWRTPSDWFGIEDVDGDKRHEVFFAEGSHGTGSGADVFYMYAPRRKRVFSVTIQETRDPYYREWVEPCEGLLEEGASIYVRAFDTRMKHSNVVVRTTPSQESPDVLWYIDNGFLKSGYVKIRRFPGPPRFGASVVAIHTDGDVEWRAFFKGPVIGYDLKRDENFVIYGPETMYNWPTCFASNSEYLWFGTNGEGVFQYNKKTQFLAPMPPSLTSKDLRLVSSIELKDSKLIIDRDIQVDVPWTW